MNRLHFCFLVGFSLAGCPAPFDPVAEKLQPPPCTSDADCAADIIGSEWGERYCALRPSGFGNCQPGTPQPLSDAGSVPGDSGAPASGAAPTADSGLPPQSDAGAPAGDGGSGSTDGGETNDDGGTPRADAGDDGCDEICLQDQVCRDGVCVDPSCGDGLREGDEECDDGNVAPDDACTDSCAIAECGDGIQRTDLDADEEGYEACDDGNLINTDGCDTDCVRNCSPACGEGEACIPSGDDLVCRPIVCGDGRLDPGEACDDGNQERTDACVNLPNGNCAEARCGDTYLQANAEACDDGNVIDGDGCSGSCQIEAECDGGCGAEQVCRDGQCEDIGCGNGHVEAGEQCDDGNDDNTDECIDDCRRAVCGDGHIRAGGAEACDDGDNNSNDRPDACREDCTEPRCGDEIVDTGEDCDDGNAIGDDGCSQICRLEGSTVCDLFRDEVFSSCGGCHTGETPSGGLLMDMTNARSFYESLQAHQNRFQLNLIGLEQGEGNHLNSYLYHKLAGTQATVRINKGLTCNNDFERPCASHDDCENDGRCEGFCEDPNRGIGPPSSCTPDGNECQAPRTCMNLQCSENFAPCANDGDCGADGGTCQGFCGRDVIACTPDGNECHQSEICAGSAPMDCGALCGSRMPMGGPDFTAERLARVQQWLDLPQDQGGPFVCTDREPCEEDNQCAIGEVCDTGLCRVE